MDQRAIVINQATLTSNFLPDPVVPYVFEPWKNYENIWEEVLQGTQHILSVLQQWIDLLPSIAIGSAISKFLFYYPLVMAYAWMIGAIIYYLVWERRDGDTVEDMPVFDINPRTSILVPCHNEGNNIQETIEYLLKQKYPNFEIVAINDGSTDNTLAVLTSLADQHKQLRVVNLVTNQGKAMALRAGALLANGEYLICIDGDALLGPEAIAWMMRHFLSGPRVGAITGNPRIRTRSTLLGKIQVGEFSAIIGLIKRAQRIYGRVFTVSGVLAAFRRSALHSVGYWSNDMVTEDIDITWKLHLNGWDIRYEPNALCWVLMPETLKGLWRQRLRWAQGGAEVLLRYWRQTFTWSGRSMWLIYIEYLTSITWSYLIISAMVYMIVSKMFGLRLDLLDSIRPTWTGMWLSITCLMQFAVSLAIDSRYEAKAKGSGRYYYWMIWYPLIYWLINVFTGAAGVLKAVMKKKGQRAIWVTVDRGISKYEPTDH